MDLVIDIGNTLTKIAVFKGKEIIRFSYHKKISVYLLQEILDRFPAISNTILSSVVGYDKEINAFLSSSTDLFTVTDHTKLPIKNLYTTPHTQGRDRLAATIGANTIFANRNVLVIDAGTCIKYDFINNKNQYLGGGISPGIDMRFKALNMLTGKLPYIRYRKFDKLIGRTTEESILSGVLNGSIAEVKGIINEYRQQYSNLKVVISGGQMDFFIKKLLVGSKEKSNIFAEPFLVLKGLHAILDYNIKR